MESVLEQPRAEVSANAPDRLLPGDWDAVQTKIEAYLRAWRVPERVRSELAAQAMLEARCRALQGDETDPERLAIRAIDKSLAAWLGGVRGTDKASESEQKLALLFSGLNDALGNADDANFRADFQRGLAAVKKTQEPRRERETSLTTMETSLSRLPSFRMVAGWFALILLIVLGFIFTH